MSGIIHKTHQKDRYRTVFCDEDFYKSHQDIFKLWKNRFGDLNSVEKVTAWVIGLSCLRRPTDWFGGERPSPFLPDTSAHTHPLTLRQLLQDTPIRTPARVNAETDLLEFTNRYRIKALPESCFRSLVFTASGRYPLTVTDQVPTPQELLQLQIGGRRIISLNENHNEWPGRLYADRDFLGFVLHDLIHADHFFFEPHHRDGQLGFYRFVETLLHTPQLQMLLQKENFRAGFEYIISDMNSHPLHLFQTLHSLVYSTCRDDVLAERVWTAWLTQDEFSSDETAALNQINTPGFTVPQAKLLELLCIRLSQKSPTARLLP